MRQRTTDRILNRHQLFPHLFLLTIMCLGYSHACPFSRSRVQSPRLLLLGCNLALGWDLGDLAVSYACLGVAQTASATRGARTRRQQASRSSETRIQERRREQGDETRMHRSHGVKLRFVGAGRSWLARERRTAGTAHIVQRRDQTEKWARGCLPSSEGVRWYLCPTGPTVRS